MHAIVVLAIIVSIVFMFFILGYVVIWRNIGLRAKFAVLFGLKFKYLGKNITLKFYYVF